MRVGISIVCGIIILMFTSCASESHNEKVKNNVTLEGENIGGLDRDQVIEILNSYSKKMDIEVVDAAYDEKTWTLSREERPGKKVNIEKTLEVVMNAEEGQNVELIFDDLLPKLTSLQVKQGIKEIASYTTPLLDRRDSRINNIDIASSEVDYYKLLPGEEFSFNKVVGRRAEWKGYENAPIIVKTPEGPKKKLGLGGGVCQLSTTLYNAAEECGLEITERHLHSKSVGYVPKGEDATVSYGSVDLKFRNNRNYPIMIRVFLKSRSLTVKIYENATPFGNDTMDMPEIVTGKEAQKAS